MNYENLAALSCSWQKFIEPTIHLVVYNSTEMSEKMEDVEYIYVSRTELPHLWEARGGF